MQEEISQKSMTFIIQTGKMTGKVFLQAIQKYLALERQKRQLNARDKALHPAYKGRMTIREMMKERSGLANIEFHDEHIHDFERIARCYGIEYAIKKERDKTPPHYLVFFRGRDTDVLQTAFSEFVRKRLKVQERPSLHEKLQKLNQQHKARATRVPEKVQRTDLAPKYLLNLAEIRKSKGLAASTQKKILDTSKRFFNWAKRTYAREFNTVPLEWIDTLRLLRQPQKLQVNMFVTEQEVRKLATPPAPPSDLALIRDQAAAAFLFLSGIRASAFVSLSICAIDLENLTVYQWPELCVKTKNGKKATTFLYNVPDLIQVIKRWDDLVRETLPENACWYAPIYHLWGEQSISQNPPGKNRSHALSRRMKVLFTRAQLEYKSPHKFRHGNAVYGLLHARTLADYKAVSMNLMHENLEVTDGIYAPLLSSDVKTRITELSDNAIQPPDNTFETFLDSLEKEKLGKALLLIAEKLIG